MPDWNIYIREIKSTSNGDSQTDPNNQPKPETEPFKPKPPLPKQDEEVEMGDETVASTLASIKGFVPVMVATAAIKQIDKVITTVEPMISQTTGDYRFGIEYQNAKKAIQSILNPYGAVMSMIQMRVSLRVNELRKEQERLLLGDSIINSFSGKKV